MIDWKELLLECLTGKMKKDKRERGRERERERERGRGKVEDFKRKFFFSLP
jgi:hypothetical protein